MGGLTTRTLAALPRHRKPRHGEREVGCKAQIPRFRGGSRLAAVPRHLKKALGNPREEYSMHGYSTNENAGLIPDVLRRVSLNNI